MTIWRNQVTLHLLLPWPENYPTHWTAWKSLQVGQWEPEAQISRYSRGQTAPWCGHWGQKLWTHGFENTTWQSVIFSSTEAMGTLTLQHSPTFPSPIKSQIKDLAVVIYPIPLCNAIRCLETPRVLNSNYCVLFFFLPHRSKSFLHIFLLCNMIHWPKTFAFINKIPWKSQVKMLALHRAIDVKYSPTFVQSFPCSSLFNESITRFNDLPEL